MDRREFLKGTFWMGATAAAAGCMSEGFHLADGGPMATYADKPLRKLRVGIVGLGRGQAGVKGFNAIPGNEIVAVADLNEHRRRVTVEACVKAGRPKPRVYSGAEDWKRMCEADDIDLIYNATPWALHVPIALYAMEHGKHVVIEVPSAFTVEECWQLVETSERTRRHCMQLENCCYGEAEMLALNLVRQGVLGDIVHGEGAYIHDLRTYNYGEFKPGVPGAGDGYWNYWRLRHNVKHGGNQYTTHGLLPVMQYMNVNRGDRFDFLVSVDSRQSNFEAYARAAFAAGEWQHDLKVGMGDMNTSIIRTVKGRTIMLQHDVSSPRPYTRLNRVTGTKGILEGIAFPGEWGGSGCPVRFGWEEKPGAGVHSFFDEEKAKAMRAQYRHPLWKLAGELAQKLGGHGGMDFLMVLRLSYCLQNGLPLDMNVYDLAASCCLCELSEKSAANRGRSMDIPDFTRGAWETVAPLGIESVDLSKLGDGMSV